MNLDELKSKYKNLSEEEKRKYIVYSIFGVIVFCFVIFSGMYLFKDTKKEIDVTEIGVPESKDAKKYNSKIEAIQAGQIDTIQESSVNSKIDELFGSSSTVSTENNENIQESPTNELDNAIAQSSAPQNNGGARNSHNTYGNYDMWRTTEPSNNSIEYAETDAMPQPQTKTSIKKTTSNSYNSETPISQESTPVRRSKIAVYSINDKKSNGNSSTSSNNSKLVSAEILGTRNKNNTVTEENNAVKFRTTEDFNFGGTIVPRRTILIGYAKLTPSRVQIKIVSMELDNNIVNCDIDVYDNNGQKGLEVIGGTGKKITDEAGSDLESEVNSNETVNKIPGAGALIKTIFKRTPKAIINRDFCKLKINKYEN